MKPRAQPSPDAVAGDIGPALVIERGEREAGRIATTRGEGKRAKVADPLNRIGLGAPAEAIRRRHAAERLRDLRDAAAGQQGEHQPKVDKSFDPMGLLPAERWLSAKAAYTRAWQAIGPTYSAVVQWVVIGGGTLDGYARAKRLRDDTAREWLLAGLDRIP